MSDRYVEREPPPVDYRELGRSRHVAAKDYVCDWCKRPIPKGSRYWRLAHLVDGRFEFLRGHSLMGKCLDVMDELDARVEDSLRTAVANGYASEVFGMSNQEIGAEMIEQTGEFADVPAEELALAIGRAREKLGY